METKGRATPKPNQLRNVLQSQHFLFQSRATHLLSITFSCRLFRLIAFVIYYYELFFFKFNIKLFQFITEKISKKNKAVKIRKIKFPKEQSIF